MATIFSNYEQQQQTMEEEKTCEFDDMKDVVEINHQWKKDYTSLQEEYNILKVRLISIEQRNEELEKQNLMLSQQLGVVNFDTESQQSFRSEHECSCSKDDVQVLKQQLMVYKEDFMQEKNDHHRASKENKKLKTELQNAQRLVDRLSLKNNIIKDNFRKVCYEKDHIMQELRKLTLTPSTVFTPSNAPSTMPSRHHYNNTTEYKSYTLKPQRYGSEESLKSEDVIAHSPNFYKANSYFCGGHVKNDGAKSSRPQST